MSGWLKFHRSLLLWEWYHDPVCRGVFFHILLSANYEPKRWQSIEIFPGQLVTSYEKLGKPLGFGVQSVRTALHKLKSTGELTVQTNSKFSVITIIKWEQYQDTNTPANNQLTGNQQSTNNNLRKKERKKEVTLPSPENVSPEIWDSWMEVRRMKKAAFTERAYKMIVKELAGFHSEGYNLDSIISSAVKGGWTSLHPKPENKTKASKNIDPRIIAMRGG